MVVASMSQFYNIPMFNWAATAVALGEYERYMAVSKVINTSLK